MMPGTTWTMIGMTGIDKKTEYMEAIDKEGIKRNGNSRQKNVKEELR